MKKKILAISLVVGSLFVSGCGFIFVARSRPYTPGYCYDCHDSAGWHRVYTECGHYEILVAHDGYRYRPRHGHKHQEYKFAKYDHSRDRQEREKEENSSRDKSEKEKRSKH